MKKYIGLNVVYLITSAAFSLGGCAHKSAASGKTEIDSNRVELTSVRLLRPKKDLIIPGELVPYFGTDIFPKVKGFVKKLNVDRGSIVAKGQILCVIEAPELNSDLDDARAKLMQGMANHIASKATYDRLVQTNKTAGAVAPNELSVARAKMDADAASVESARAVVDNKTKMVQYLTIKAPFSGIISTRNISVGDLVGPDEASRTRSLFSLQEEKRLRLTVAVPETYTGQLQNKTQVSFRVSALPERIFNASLSRSSGSLDVNTRTMTIEFDVENSDGALKSGMYAEVILPVERNTATSFVPLDAVVNSTQGNFLIIDKDNKAVRVSVKKGISIDSLIEVFGDIHASDKIVRQASDEIKEGDALN